ncbi:UDP-glucose/GDP-mannose dehydrogenase family protein [Bdellovibrio bacteriovorus]|uniref:UDP-glucose dehydrogenase family protein n=1 Tax=Bdellovibrio bacteriovorus TaxID=959 RepID=UPI0035A70FD0
MKISILGTGYVGLVTGVCFAEHGNHVICADVDANKITSLKNGTSPIYEPGLEPLIEKNLKSEHLLFTTDLKQSVELSEIIFIAVGTPSDHDGSADLRYVLEVASFIGATAATSKIVVVKSTVPVGTCKKVKEVINSKLAERACNFAIDVCSNPEFLREGSAVSDCLKPTRVVIGTDTQESAQKLKSLYSTFIESDAQIIMMDPASSELTKYAANTMLAARISFMNELSQICDKMGANIEHIRKGIGTDPRIGPHFLNAGIGYGGSCFPKDVRALSRSGRDAGLNLRLLSSIAEANNQQKENFFIRIKAHFSENLMGTQIAIWGLSFKPGTDDLREAPSLDLILALTRSGATVRVYDPISGEKFQSLLKSFPDHFQKNVQLAESPYHAIEGADALCIVTEWPEFKNTDISKIRSLLKQPLIFDGRNIFELGKVRNAGIEYHSVGRPTIFRNQ